MKIDWNKIYNTLYKFARYHKIDEDLVSEVIEVYLTKYTEKTENQTKTIAYLKRMLKTRFIDQHRRTLRKMHIEMIDIAKARYISNDDENEFDILSEEQIASILYSEVQTKMYLKFGSDTHFVCFNLYLNKQLSIRDIASHIDVNYSKIRQVLAECLDFLKEEYQTPIHSFIGRMRNDNRKPVIVYSRKRK